MVTISPTFQEHCKLGLYVTQKVRELSDELVKQQEMYDALSRSMTPSPEPHAHSSPEHTAIIAQRIGNQQSRVPLEEELARVKQEEEVCPSRRFIKLDYKWY